MFLRPISRLAPRLVLIALTLAAAPGIRPGPAAARPADGVSTLMPVPFSLTVGEGRFRIDEGLTIAPAGNLARAEAGNVRSGVTDRALKAAGRFMARLAGRTGLFFKQDYLASRDASVEARVRYTHARPGVASQYDLGADEL